jgi:hypothetical protein
MPGVPADATVVAAVSVPVSMQFLPSNSSSTSTQRSAKRTCLLRLLSSIFSSYTLLVLGIGTMIATFVALMVAEWLAAALLGGLGLVVTSAGILGIGCCGAFGHPAASPFKQRVTPYANTLSTIICLVCIITFASVFAVNHGKRIHGTRVSYVCCPPGANTPDCTVFCTTANGRVDEIDMCQSSTAWRSVCETPGGGRCTQESKCTPEACLSRWDRPWGHTVNCWAPENEVGQCGGQFNGVDYTNYVPLTTNKKDDQCFRDATGYAMALVGCIHLYQSSMIIPLCCTLRHCIVASSVSTVHISIESIFELLI